MGKWIVEKNKGQIQQGDVWLERVPEIPADAQPVSNGTKAVFAEGEGHHVHRAATAGSVELYEKNGMRYARVLRRTSIEHVTPDGRRGEHRSIRLEPGDYQYGQVVEYDYLAEMAREVVD